MAYDLKKFSISKCTLDNIQETILLLTEELEYCLETENIKSKNCGLTEAIKGLDEIFEMLELETTDEHGKRLTSSLYKIK